jgi:peptidoglycan hydrolase-like protein with peptidoglycan-binding domain
MTQTNTFASKLTVAFVAIAMMFAAIAPVAQAQTAEELQAQIAQLMATINALQSQVGQGGTSVASGICPYTWTRSLSQGTTGDDVMKLQQFLNADEETRVSASGAGSVGAETMYYGPATAAAVSKFQVKYRADILSPLALVNPTGFFGPSSIAKANSLCASAPVTTPTDPVDEDEDDAPTTGGPLQGGEADIKVEILTDGPQEIGLGKAETVLEFEVEATDGDVSINRVDFTFASTTGVVRPWLYFDEVNLLVNGTEVASLSRSSDFTDLGGSTGYRARFSGLNLIIREDDTADVALELVAKDSLGGTRVNDTFTVSSANDGMRFVDSTGVTETGGAVANSLISFDDTFGDGEINVTVSDKSPENATIVLNEKTRTNGVAVVVVEVEAEDDDMEVTDFWVTIYNGGQPIGTVVNRARLFAGNTLLGTKAVTGSGQSEVVKFDKVDLMIDEDDMEEFRVELDFNRGDSALTSSLTPSTFTVGSTTVVAENRNFDSTGAIVTNITEAHTLIVEGVVADFDKVTTSSVNDGKDVTITFTMDVTAYGKDYYISENGASTFIGVITGPGATTTVSTSTVTVVGVTKNSDNSYRISKGQTREVRVSYVVRSSAGGFVQARLDTLRYGALPVVNFALTSPLGVPDFEVKDVSIVATTGL